nr:MAG TPA: hypothetical protein [Caudoviricetes sp.]
MGGLILRFNLTSVSTKTVCKSYDLHTFYV